MATAKSRAASKKSAPSRSRSAASRKSSRAQTATSAGDNQPGANALNEQANAEANAEARAADAATARDEAIKATETAELEARKDLDPKVAALIFDTSEPQTSLNSLPKDEGGLPADVITGLRAEIDQHRGAAALGQPGQDGHGVGTGTAGLAGVMTDEEAAANEKEYAARFK